jgi:hypothetical protein
MAAHFRRDGLSFVKDRKATAFGGAGDAGVLDET